MKKTVVALLLVVAMLCTMGLSAMAEKPLMISMVKQKTFIDVNEKGTEAAAVTFIGFATTAYRPEEPPTVDFFVDRPFLFVIREISTGAVLFMGQKVK